MYELYRILVISLILGVTLPALLVTLIYLVPNRVLLVQTAVSQQPRRVFLIGAVNAFFFGLISAVFANTGELGGLIALIILLLLSGMGLIGLASITRLLNQRLFQTEGVGDTLKTAVLLTVAMLTPFVGWLLLAPILGIMGIGGFVMTLFRREKNSSN